MGTTKINKHILDSTIDMDLDLIRLETATSIKAIDELKKMRIALTAMLSDGVITKWTRRDLQHRLSEANIIIDEIYAELELINQNATQGLVDSVASETGSAIAVSLGDKSMPIIPPTKAYINTISRGAVTQGAVQKDWWSKQSKDMAFRFSVAVKTGLINAETNDQIISRVRDAIGIAENNADKLVRTSIQTVANETRDEVFKRNSDVIAAKIWVTALDGKACQYCIARDGLEWDIENKPIGHSIPFQVPPIHFGDRCSMVARTKTFRELGIDVDEMSHKQRASATGFVEDSNFESYMNRRGKSFIDGVLGKGKSELYRSGVITFNQLVDMSGTPLTLEELQKKYL